MDFLWAFYQQGQAQAATQASTHAVSLASQSAERVAQLEKSMDQLKLINIAFAELLVHRLGVPESDLIAKIKEIDMRDGVQDGRMSSGARLCPTCHRRYDMKLNKCLYCGFVDPSTQTIFDKIG